MILICKDKAINPIQENGLLEHFFHQATSIPQKSFCTYTQARLHNYPIVLHICLILCILCKIICSAKRVFINDDLGGRQIGFANTPIFFIPPDDRREREIFVPPLIFCPEAIIMNGPLPTNLTNDTHLYETGPIPNGADCRKSKGMLLFIIPPPLLTF